MVRVLRENGRPRVGVLVAAGLTWLACLAAPAFADDQPIVGVIDQARLVKIPAGTEILIIGNPTIADVTLLKQNNLMVLTPKSFGETNFIALDNQGKPLAESTIRVVNEANALIVQRGMDRQSYSCAPRCQPVQRLGDDDKYLSGVASQAQAYSARIAAAAPPTQPGLMAPH